ncbi:glycosyltransferase family 39 protein [Chloroflexi bacterium TSY]|nr:glycosyltransferase family 39 protein [Chloroflexi bacterium TSY]
MTPNPPPSKDQKIRETIERIYQTRQEHPPFAHFLQKDGQKSASLLDEYAIPLVLLITGIGLFLRLFLIGSKTMWLDEAFSVWVANHPLTEAWAWLIKIDQHPPLYYSLLNLWQQLFGDLQGVVRSFSALCGTLAIPFLFGAARRLGNVRIGLLSALILAIAPFHIWFSQETRMYTLLTLEVAAALYFLTRILFEPQELALSTDRRTPSSFVQRWQTIRFWVGLGVAQAAIMLTHNTAAVYFPVCINLVILTVHLMQTRRTQPSSLPALNQSGFLRAWIGGQILAFLLWLPWAYPFVRQVVMVDGEFWIGPPTLKTIWNTFHNFNQAYLPGWFPLFNVWDYLYGALAIVGVVYLYRQKTPARANLLITLFLLPSIIALLVSLRRPIFYDRTLIWTTLPYYILIATGLDAIGQLTTQTPSFALFRHLSFSRLRLIWRPLQAALIAGMIVLSGFSLNSYYYYFQKEDWAKAADYVAQHMLPGDMIIFNATWVQIPFEYYLRHHNIEATLKGLPADLFQRGILEPKMTEADLPYMRELIKDQEHVWLVYSHDWYTDPSQIIPNELNQQMIQVDWQEFVGLKVMKFDPR